MNLMLSDLWALTRKGLVNYYVPPPQENSNRASNPNAQSLATAELADALSGCPGIQIAPAEDEVALLRNYEGAFAELARPEQVLSVLATVPRLRAKLQCLLFRRQAEVLFTEAEAALQSVQAACEQVS